jgi:hypothetical protein
LGEGGEDALPVDLGHPLAAVGDLDAVRPSGWSTVTWMGLPGGSVLAGVVDQVADHHAQGLGVALGCTISRVAATPALAGHAAVHQHHVRDQLLDQGDGGLAGVGLARHLPAADLLEQGAQHPPRAAGPRDGRLHGLSVGGQGSRMNSEALGFST